MGMRQVSSSMVLLFMILISVYFDQIKHAVIYIYRMGILACYYNFMICIINILIGTSQNLAYWSWSLIHPHVLVNLHIPLSKKKISIYLEVSYILTNENKKRSYLWGKMIFII